jgi:serine/threonine-protein kinase
MIVGTIDYMSPEQLRGETVDTRSDIFSVGAILYEMLTGRPAFKRGTPAESVAAILKEDPPDARPIPWAVDRIVSRCLEKTREARFQSARDLAFGLTSLPDAAATERASQVSSRGAALRRASQPWAVATVVALVCSMILVRGLLRREVPRPALRLTAELGMDASLPFVNIVDGLSLSPDGGVIAFVAQKPAAPGYGTFRGVETPPQLYVRRLDQLEATPLPGTDGALSPFFSPDGRSLGFFAGGTLKKIAVTGGEVITLSDAPNGRGGTWSEDNTIVFSPNQTRNTRLLRLSSDGGKTEPLTAAFVDETIQLWPQVLPGGKAVLYTGSSVAGNYNDANLVVQALPSGARRTVLQGGYHARYMPSGHLLYMHNGVLLAAPFDVARLAVTGRPVALLEGLASNSGTGSAQFAVSANGTLVYLPGESVGPGTRLRWLDRDGNTTPLRVASGNWFNPLFAPDGRRLAVEIREKTSDVWIYQFDRDTLTRFTFESAGAARPVWTPDGRRIVFSSARDGAASPNLYWQRFPEMGGAERLTDSANAQQPGSCHPTGRFVAFEETDPQTGADLMILPLEGDETAGWKPGKPTVFLRSQSREAEPMFSPDGRWLAYSSNQSGRDEVYVRPFPGPGTATQISEGGNFPVWSRARQEIFYSLNGQIMVAPFTVEGASFRPEKPMLWSRGRYSLRGADRMFDLYPDGNRLALASSVLTFGGAKEDRAVFIFNILDELRRIAPAK